MLRVVDVFEKKNSLGHTNLKFSSSDILMSICFFISVNIQHKFDKAMLSKNQTVKDCVDLYSTHEEADTRMILHAIYADKQFGSGNLKGRIIVKSPDSDVRVLCVHYFSSMKNTTELWFETGTVTSTKDARRFIPIHELCNSLNSIVSQCLPAVHAISGCDTTSAMFGIGK